MIKSIITITKNFMKKPIPRKQLVAEIAGWYGASAILTAYALASFSILSNHDLIFQLLNLTGALGVIIIAAYKKVAQSIVLNVVWSVVAVIAIIEIII